MGTILSTDDQLPCQDEQEAVDEEHAEQLPYTAPAMLEFPPTFGEKFIETIDKPLEMAEDRIYGKQYLLCDINKYERSYRSPWSNTYEPPLVFSSDTPPQPLQQLRNLEIDMNFGFDEYYSGGFASAYAVPIDTGFAMVVLLKKEHTGSIKAVWDTVHVFEVVEIKPTDRAYYRLTSKSLLWLESHGDPGYMQLGGTMSHQMQREEPVSKASPHVAAFGKMIDAMELKIRNTLNLMCFGRTRESYAV